MVNPSNAQRIQRHGQRAGDHIEKTVDSLEHLVFDPAPQQNSFIEYVASTVNLEVDIGNLGSDDLTDLLLKLKDLTIHVMRRGTNLADEVDDIIAYENGPELLPIVVSSPLASNFASAQHSCNIAPILADALKRKFGEVASYFMDQFEEKDFFATEGARG